MQNIEDMVVSFLYQLAQTGTSSNNEDSDETSDSRTRASGNNVKRVVELQLVDRRRKTASG